MGYRYEKIYFIHKKTGIVDKLTVSCNLLTKNELFSTEFYNSVERFSDVIARNGPPHRRSVILSEGRSPKSKDLRTDLIANVS